MKDALAISESGSNEGPRFGGGLRLSGTRNRRGIIGTRAPVAQWIERRPPEPKVAGSNPVGRAISSTGPHRSSSAHAGDRAAPGGSGGATAWRARRRRQRSAHRHPIGRQPRPERSEEPDQLRTAFERDRDRIIHSKAFRRLKHKTQVFLNPDGDHYVTRLTHTLQVTQIARSLAAALSLNEPLAEAIALGHDVGHTPFGHTGEEAL